MELGKSALPTAREGSNRTGRECAPACPVFSWPVSKNRKTRMATNPCVNGNGLERERVGESRLTWSLHVRRIVNGPARECRAPRATCRQTSRYVTPCVARRPRTQKARGGLPRASISPGATGFELPLSRATLPRPPGQMARRLLTGPGRFESAATLGVPTGKRGPVGRQVPLGGNVAPPTGQSPQGVTSESAKAARFRVLRLRLACASLVPLRLAAMIPIAKIRQIRIITGPFAARPGWDAFRGIERTLRLVRFTGRARRRQWRNQLTTS
jgi:hypothetical protein